MSLVEEKILITGMGVESPWGNSGGALADGLGLPRSCHGCSECRSGVGGPCGRDRSVEGTPGGWSRFSDPTSKLLAACAMMAIDEAGIPVDQPLGESCGVAVGATLAAVDTIVEFYTAAVRLGLRGLRPVSFPNTVLNAPVGRLAIALGIRGPNAALGAGEICGMDALVYAANLLRRARAKRCLAGSVYIRSNRFSQALCRSRAMEVPDRAGSLVVVETGEAARDRRAQGLAQVSAAASIFLPAGLDGKELLAGVLGAVLRQAGLRPEDVDLLVSATPRHSEHGCLEEGVLRETFSTGSASLICLEDAGYSFVDATGSLAVAAVASGLAREPGLQHALICGLSHFGHGCFVVLSRPEWRGAGRGAGS